MTDRRELNWRASSRSGGGNCVEIAMDGDLVHMRDSKDRSGPTLTFPHASFEDFLDYLKEEGVGHE